MMTSRLAVAVLGLGGFLLGACGGGTPAAVFDSGGGEDAPSLDGGGSDGGDVDGPVPPDASNPDAAGPIDGAADLPPSCAITAPLDGTSVEYDQDVTFVASASDPEDGALSGPSVVWQSDLAVSPLGSGLFITIQLPVPGVHTITCTATDSLGQTGTDSIVVTSLSPVAEIFHPGDGEVRPSASPVPFTGDARDFEDGLPPDAALVWTSSLDGMIGTGRMFNALLSPGTNVITLTVTDSDGNTGTRSITLTMTP